MKKPNKKTIMDLRLEQLDNYVEKVRATTKPIVSNSLLTNQMRLTSILSSIKDSVSKELAESNDVVTFLINNKALSDDAKIGIALQQNLLSSIYRLACIGLNIDIAKLDSNPSILDNLSDKIADSKALTIGAICQKTSSLNLDVFNLLSIEDDVQADEDSYSLYSSNVMGYILSNLIDVKGYSRKDFDTALATQATQALEVVAKFGVESVMGLDIVDLVTQAHKGCSCVKCRVKIISMFSDETKTQRVNVFIDPKEELYYIDTRNLFKVHETLDAVWHVDMLKQFTLEGNKGDFKEIEDFRNSEYNIEYFRK